MHSVNPHLWNHMSQKCWFKFKRCPSKYLPCYDPATPTTKKVKKKWQPTLALQPLTSMEDLNQKDNKAKSTKNLLTDVVNVSSTALIPKPPPNFLVNYKRALAKVTDHWRFLLGFSIEPIFIGTTLLEEIGIVELESGLSYVYDKLINYN